MAAPTRVHSRSAVAVVEREAAAPIGPGLSLSLRCSVCYTTAEHATGNVYVHPDSKERRGEASGWDGIVFERIFSCPSCRAEDEYTLTHDARMRVGVGLLERLADPARPATAGPLFVGEWELWDGTKVRRPSEGLRHLRALAESGTSGEGWRLLGAFARRAGRPDEAHEAWQTALAIDPGEVYAAYHLALAAFEEEAFSQAIVYLACGIERLTARPHDESRRKLGCALAFLLHDVVCSAPEGVEATFEAEWLEASGTRAKGAVAVRAIQDWDGFAEFLGSSRLARARLIGDARVPALGRQRSA